MPKTGLHRFPSCEDPNPGFGLGALVLGLAVFLVLRHPGELIKLLLPSRPF